LIRGKVEGGKPGDVQKVGVRLISETKKILKSEAVLMTSHTRKTYMSGPRPVLLGVRTGNLRSQTKPLPVTERPGVIESGMGFGTAYARPHVGPKGQVTTIRPVRAKWLTIPLPAAMTKAGVPRGAAQSGMWGETFFARSKKGNLILFGKRVAQKGAHAGEARGDVVPLFVLKKQVQIKSRVHPEVILAWEKPRMIAAFAQIGIRLKGA
jgi:hypothetical protein